MKHHYFNALSMMRRTHKAYYYKRPAIIKRTSWIFESTNKGGKQMGKRQEALAEMSGAPRPGRGQRNE